LFHVTKVNQEGWFFFKLYSYFIILSYFPFTQWMKKWSLIMWPCGWKYQKFRYRAWTFFSKKIMIVHFWINKFANLLWYYPWPNKGKHYLCNRFLL
jgi:hypothetical protein